MTKKHGNTGRPCPFKGQKLKPPASSSSVRLSEARWEQIRAEATRCGISNNQMIETALAHYFKFHKAPRPSCFPG